MNYPLVLGTAQFGSHYGITNSYGCPSDGEINAILNCFFEAGYTFLDTAQGYGNAHQKIADWIKNNFKYSKEKSSLNIITKISLKNNISAVIENVQNICEDLGVNNLYSLLIHNPEAIVDNDEFHLLDEQIKSLKKNNVVQKAGVSVYSPKEIYNCWERASEFDMVQCPINIFDQRFLEPKVQLFCKNNEIEVHGRSLFLQGTLLAPSIPTQLQDRDVRKAMDRYHMFLKNHKISGIQACGLFAQKHNASVPFWVVGFNARSELEEFISMNEQVQNKNDDMDFDGFLNREYYVDPRTWSYLKS